MAKSNDNLTLRFNVWYARVGIPRDLQGIMGVTMLIESTGQTDHAKARVASLPILARMRARIADARTNAVDPIKTEAAKLARKYMEAKAVSADVATTILITEVLEFALETLPRASAIQARHLLPANLPMALAAVPGATDAVAMITGKHTPWRAHEAAWHAAKGFGSKTLHDYRATMGCFVKTVGKTCEALTWEDVEAWLDGLKASGNGPKTLERKLATVGGYYNWMVAKRLINDTNKPFAGHEIERNKMVEAKNARRRFEPHDMVAILAVADATCETLGDLTAFAMFTGARRESLAGLNVANIATSTDGIRHFQFADKTESGVRDCPVHKAIAARLDRRIANATAEGQLFPGNADKHGDFGAALGQKFGTLKTEMGFDHRFTFHCIRKTFTYLMGEAKVEEKVINDIAGWENGTMRARYGQEASLQTKAAALAKLKYPKPQR